ncbi:immunoglobulin-like and fibronectin type III domain-containing protein 1 isoform X2 [Amia ocellicauda]|uniref:immunoglobulin-like and fibronectin type III domain-containing protein 1 isoform X2 n=1 Tax=Amia ocellicauda TaxID=2972642 RepID=UPI0034648008
MYQITPENCSHLRASQFPKMKTSKITNGTASGQDAIKRRSKTGVIITQFTEELPDGCSFPDFERKPIALTIQEGKTATFKAIVKGNPKPEVTWKRVKGTMDDPNKFKMIYDKFTDEHALQVIKLTGQEADNYKCYATNDYGEAVCTAGLIVIEIGFKKKSMPQEENEATRKDPTEFRKLLRKRVSKDPEAKEEKVMDEKVWEILLSSDKKDYERICIEYGITDFRGMLKRLNEMKMEREEEQAKFIDALSNLKPIAVNKEGIAEFELDLELKDSNSRIFLYKDGVMIPFNKEMVMKHSLKQTGKKYTFSIKDLLPEDAGLYQVDVEDTTIFSTDLTFKAIPINFICPIKEVKAQEREDALFECVLSHPSASVVWMGKNKPIQSSEKYEITMSEDKLIHRLLVKDVMPVDKGIYAIVAGIRSSSAWLMVESTDDPSTRGKKKARKTTRAGGSGDLIESIAQEQAEKLKHLGFKPEDEGVAEDRAEAGARAGDVTGGVINGMGGQRGLGDGQGEPVGKSDDHSGSGPGKVENGPRQGGTGDAGASGQRIDSGLGSGQDIRGLTDDQNRKNKSAGGLGELAVHFTSGLSDVHAQKGHAAELVCKLNSDQSEGVWFKDGQTLSSRDGLTISKEGACHKLTIAKADESSSGKYRFEAEGHKTEAHVIVEEQDSSGLTDDQNRKNRRAGRGPLTEDTIVEPAVHFTSGLSDVHAQKGHAAELVCKLNSDQSKGVWFKDGQKLSSRDGLTISKEGACHKLTIAKADKSSSGKYRFEAEGHKTEAHVIVEEQDSSGLTDDQNRKNRRAGRGPLTEDTIVEPAVHFTSGLSDVHAQKGHAAELVCKLNSDQSEGVWFKDGQTLSSRDGLTISKEGACHDLTISKADESSSGKYRFEAEGCKTEAHVIVEEQDSSGLTDDQNRKNRRAGRGPLTEDTIVEPAVHFTSGLSDVHAQKGHAAELVCKLNSDQSEGVWFKDGEKLSSRDGLTISKEGACHKLTIAKADESSSGKYRFEAEGRKTEAHVIVEDPPVLSKEDIEYFSKPIAVKAGQNAELKMPFEGRPPFKVSWFRDGEELLDDKNVKVEMGPNHSRLLLTKCKRKNGGEIKVKIKNDNGTVEAMTNLVVLDKPSPPQGPVEVLESSPTCIEFKWRPPRDDGGAPVLKYSLERQQVGRNTWTKLGEVPGNTHSFATNQVEHGRKYCFRIQALTAEGASEVLETDEITAGMKAYPSPPAPPKVVSATSKCITLSWSAPHNTGGSRIAGYIVEKRKKGSNIWSRVSDEPIQERKFAVKDIVEGQQFEFRVSAINVSGAGEPSVPSDFIFARDPMKPPGKIQNLKVTDSSYTTLSLSWAKPNEDEGDAAKGYYVEIKSADSLHWRRCNAAPIGLNSYTIKGLKSMGMYFIRVVAANDGGEGEPQELQSHILAMPPPVRPRFLTDASVKSFMVVKAGNTVRANINFESSPIPDVTWLKDGIPVSKRATITNADGMSQLLIPSSERTDTGLYTVTIKNLFGQESFSIEIRVTDEPKPPGPAQLEENVPGTVTVSWVPSPDEKLDSRLHYMVMKRDSIKMSWHTAADHIFNNKFTAVNIMSGRRYFFRVYAKNDMGLSAPSESPAWEICKKKETFSVRMPTYKQNDLRQAPAFIVPLKTHFVPHGYECYMSCAVKGSPKPYVTWYRNNISLNQNANYLVSNVHGVCSMHIMGVSAEDNGEYVVVAENALGRAVCSTRLTVRE